MHAYKFLSQLPYLAKFTYCTLINCSKFGGYKDIANNLIMTAELYEVVKKLNFSFEVKYKFYPFVNIHNLLDSQLLLK